MTAVPFLCLLALQYASAQVTSNMTSLPSTRQLLDFKLEHSKSIGLLTVGSGAPVDVRDMITINSDLYRDELFFDSQSHQDGERLPERVVHAKGFAVWGYFEVTNDVSKYTKADVFNGIGKKTPVLGRFSVGATERGGSDVTRDLKGMVLKFYTKEGNLDFLNLQIPVFAFNDALDFAPFVHGIVRNPRTNILDITALLDLITLRPAGLLAGLYLMSDFGIPNGWRRMDSFPIHSFELNNKHGERYYVRFSFRTEQGLQNLTALQAATIQSTDLDYYVRDMYNAIENKTYPSWRLEMDVLSLEDVQKINYNPFDVTRLWKKGTFKTVTIGRLTFNKNTDNQFKDMESSAFNPSNLVPGIPGPVDSLFRGRRLAYRDTQNYRLGRNHFKIGVNAPIYEKSYKRDGVAPVWENGKDAPNYFPNSFNGPMPLVDDQKQKENLIILQSNAADFQDLADFYNKILPDEGARTRLAENLALGLLQITEPVRSRAMRYIAFIDTDLSNRVTIAYNLGLTAAAAAAALASVAPNIGSTSDITPPNATTEITPVPSTATTKSLN